MLEAAEVDSAGGHERLVHHVLDLARAGRDIPKLLLDYLLACRKPSRKRGRPSHPFNERRDQRIAAQIHIELSENPEMSMSAATRAAIKELPKSVIREFGRLRELLPTKLEWAANRAARTLGEMAWYEVVMTRIRNGEPPEEALRTVANNWSMQKADANTAYRERVLEKPKRARREAPRKAHVLRLEDK